MSEIKIGDYLFHRLAELDIKTCWGVPGDYELALLDLIGDAGIKFSGNANELIAAYAADGYSRINGAGAFVTTYGPGELSAYCGHAGAYAEFCKVVHIVGYPGVTAMKNRTLMHHTLGTGKFDMYHEMVKHISADTAILTSIETAAADIDRCLNSMLYHSRPVYIGVPVDVSHWMISAAGLQTPLQTSLPPNDKSDEDAVVADIYSTIAKASYPVMIVDGNAVRNGCVAEADRIAQLTGLPYFTTCMGKGGPNEDLPNFAGVYQGAGSVEAVRSAIEDVADCVLYLGSFRTDFNTGEFTDNVDPSVVIDLQRFFSKIGAKRYSVGIKGVLNALIQKIEKEPFSHNLDVKWDPYPIESFSPSDQLKQDYLWAALAKLFRPGDIVVGETGTSAFGLAASRIPEGCLMYNQTVFGSIGYAGPSSVGAFQAAKEAGKLKRGILVTGEGSLQLTPMCLADLLKLDHKPIVFVLNNNGYTVERLIHGKDAFYNTLPLWDYDALRSVFGPNHPSKYHGPISTGEQLDRLLADAELNACNSLQLVELVLEELDAPLSVRKTTEAIEAFNQKHAAGGSLGG